MKQGLLAVGSVMASSRTAHMVGDGNEVVEHFSALILRWILVGKSRIYDHLRQIQSIDWIVHKAK